LHESGGLLRLHVAPDRVAVAVRTLRGEGLDAHANGHGLCVRVPHAAKAGPIRVLTRADIHVDDFEILTDNDEVHP
jgi:hypothetical protein